VSQVGPIIGDQFEIRQNMDAAMAALGYNFAEKITSLLTLHASARPS
jgi:hypothetical protein